MATTLAPFEASTLPTPTRSSFAGHVATRGSDLVVGRVLERTLAWAEGV